MGNGCKMIHAETLATLRARIGLRLGEVESRARRVAQVDMVARMSAIRSKVAA